MLRKGVYATYKGKEFRCTEVDGGKIKLISDDQKDIGMGFQESSTNRNVYLKIIPVHKANNIFLIIPKAKYKGEFFPVSSGKDGKVLLDTSNTELAKKYGFERTDKYLYSKYVNEDEIEIVEEKKPYSID